MKAKDDTVSVSKARENLADILGEVRYGRKRFKLTSNGKNVGAIVTLEDLELLEAIEDKIDIELADKSLDDKESASLDEVLSELGISRDDIAETPVKGKIRKHKAA